MKKMVAVLGLMALPACMGSGGGGVETARNAPIDPVANAEMATALDGARSALLDDIVYNRTVGRIAQDHANDMFNRRYLSIYELDSTDGTAPDGRRDMGDDLVDAGLGWEEITQLVAQGDLSVQMVLDGFEANGSAPGSEGNNAADLGFSLGDNNYEFFGLGKAGSGSDRRWALLLVWPTISDR